MRDWKACSACKVINLCPCSLWFLRSQKIIIISSPLAWFVNWRKWCRRRQTTWFDHTRLSSFCHQSLSWRHHHCFQNHYFSLIHFGIINCFQDHTRLSSFCHLRPYLISLFTSWLIILSTYCSSRCCPYILFP